MEELGKSDHGLLMARMRKQARGSSVPSHASNDARLRATGKARIQVHLHSGFPCGGQSAPMGGFSTLLPCSNPLIILTSIILTDFWKHGLEVPVTQSTKFLSNKRLLRKSPILRDSSARSTRYVEGGIGGRLRTTIAVDGVGLRKASAGHFSFR